jgi:hypothetical protein
MSSLLSLKRLSCCVFYSRLSLPIALFLHCVRLECLKGCSHHLSTHLLARTPPSMCMAQSLSQSQCLSTEPGTHVATTAGHRCPTQVHVGALKVCVCTGRLGAARLDAMQGGSRRVQSSALVKIAHKIRHETLHSRWCCWMTTWSRFKHMSCVC